jgi:hypothetical protein
MAYNLSALDSAVNIADLVVFNNSVTNQLFVSSFVLALSIVMLMALKKYTFLKGFIVTCWITFVLSGFLWFGGLVSLYIPLAYLVLGALGLFIKQVSES